LENVSFERSIIQPYHSELIKKGAILTNYSGLARPSQPNYLALVSGSTHDIRTNADVSVDATNLVDLLEQQGKTWKSYTEGFPGNCFEGSANGYYCRKHQPFLSFLNVRTNKARCSKIVDASELDKDLKKGTLPDFSLYIPDNRNNGHDTGVQYADKWLSDKFGPLLKNKKFMKDMLFVLTYDEGGVKDQHIATILFGDSVKPSSTSADAYTHYNLLRTIEEGFGLGTLNREDSKVGTIRDIWKLSAR
jgi:phospholipase C